MARVKTGGRVKGSRNKRLKEHDEARAQTAHLIGNIIPEAFDGGSLTLLQGTYRNPAFELRVRLDAAKAALPYEESRLSYKEVNLKVGASESFVKLWAAISNGNAAKMAEGLDQEQE